MLNKMEVNTIEVLRDQSNKLSESLHEAAKTLPPCEEKLSLQAASQLHRGKAEAYTKVLREFSKE